MKIASIELKEEQNGICPFRRDKLGEKLGDVVILTGANGSGKTRLLDMIRRHLQTLEYKDKLKLTYLDELGMEREYAEAALLQAANYSHYDAVLQLAKRFSPYVIGKAKKLLAECNYEETALNALLVIEDMAYGYSEEFRDGKKFQEFCEFVSDKFDLKIEKTEKGIHLFGLGAEDAKLSPGQQYLLRIAVACFFNDNQDNLLIILDEPELHLHPKAMIHMVEQMRDHFKDTQFWISTHSVELISYVVSAVDDSTVVQLDQGEVSLLRSNSGKIIESLLGVRDDNLYLQQFYNLPDQYARIRFAVECLGDADTKGGRKNDPQQELITQMLTEKSIIVDYGAGQGRILEQMAMDTKEIISRIEYFAYNLPESEDEAQCKKIMNENGIGEDHYFNDISELKAKLAQSVSHVFMVNVLHEIPPKEWKGIFETIYELLKDNGKFCIIERETLTVGEAPYKQGFLMITEKAVRELFGHYKADRHDKNKHIVRYVIKKDEMKNITVEHVQKAVERIRQDSFEQIKAIKAEDRIEKLKDRYQKGIDLAFWTNQYANAALILENGF